jgi:SAM-dependent methyltransferase
MSADCVVPYHSPRTGVALLRDGSQYRDAAGGESYAIVNDIPRFGDRSNYTDSFGLQWNLFDRTQLDSHAKVDQSANRFYAETGWTPQELSTLSVLEVGSGAGRFTEAFLRTTNGVLHSVDYSSAVEANWRNNGHHGERLRLSQASIYDLPFPDNSFDRVFCLGVLQHTPSVPRSIEALVRKTRPGGEIVVDFYPIKGWYTRIHAKYLLRPFTRRLPKPMLLRLIRTHIGWMLRLFDTLCRMRLGVLTRFIPMTDVRGFPSDLSPDQRKEWAIMDTFDCFAPEFDQPQTVESVASMFRKNGCRVSFQGLIQLEGGQAAIVRAQKGGL